MLKLFRYPRSWSQSPLHNFRDHPYQGVRGKRLEQEGVKSSSGHSRLIGRSAQTGDRNDWHFAAAIGLQRAYFSQQFKPIFARHSQVRENEIRLKTKDLTQGIIRI